MIRLSKEAPKHRKTNGKEGETRRSAVAIQNSGLYDPGR